MFDSKRLNELADTVETLVQRVDEQALEIDGLQSNQDALDELKEIAEEWKEQIASIDETLELMQLEDNKLRDDLNAVMEVGKKTAERVTEIVKRMKQAANIATVGLEKDNAHQ